MSWEVPENRAEVLGEWDTVLRTRTRLLEQTRLCNLDAMDEGQNLPAPPFSIAIRVAAVGTRKSRKKEANMEAENDSITHPYRR